MAPPNKAIKRQWSEGDRDALKQLVAELNQAIADIRGITAKLDADVGVTDVNYSALWNNAAKLDTI